MAQFFRMGTDIIVKDDDDIAVIVMLDLLHFGIERRPLGFVSLGACLDEQLVEARVFPMSLVSGGITGIGGGEHPVAGGTAAPI